MRNKRCQVCNCKITWDNIGAENIHDGKWRFFWCMKHKDQSLITK